MAGRHYPVLQKIRHQGRPGILLKFYPSKAPYTRTLEILHASLSAATFRARDEYERLPANRLNWKVITDVSIKNVPIAIVRNRLRRIYASAFGKALKEQGYHDNGKQRSDAVNRRDRPSGDLKGTLEIYVFSADALKSTPQTLLRDGKSMVDAVRQHQRRDSWLPERPRGPRMRHVVNDAGNNPDYQH